MTLQPHPTQINPENLNRFDRAVVRVQRQLERARGRKRRDRLSAKLSSLEEQRKNVITLMERWQAA